MTEKIDSVIDAAQHMRSGINNLLRATISGGPVPGLSLADIAVLRASLLSQQELLDDMLVLLRDRHNSGTWKLAYRRVYEEGDLRCKQAHKIYDDRIAANGGKSIQDSGPAVVDCDC